jgi:hypothetical protein
MRTNKRSWLHVAALALILVITSILPLSTGDVSAQKNKDTLVTIEGTVDVLDEDLMVVSGEVVDVDGDSDVFIVGDQVVATVAPAGVFKPSTLREKDKVIITGVLLPDGETLKAVDLKPVNEADDAGEEGEHESGDDAAADESCVGVDPHPVAEKLADEFGEDLETIMVWFCDGFGFGEIMLALRIVDEVGGTTVEDLLARKEAGEGWGQIMRDLDLAPSEFSPGLAVGRPDGAGRPDDPGKPDDPGSQGTGKDKDNE